MKSFFKKGNSDTFYITHSGELLFWLIIILIIILISSLTHSFKENNDVNDYQIFLPDVDGLIVGSPVRMMGIEVGHVTKIKPTNEEVFVNFILTNPDVYIPIGTSVTVEFSGMAGSKSLELYLPNKDTLNGNDNLLTVNAPKRLHDALGLLNNMMKKLGSIVYTTSNFGTKLKDSGLNPDDISTSSESMKDLLEYSNKLIEKNNIKILDYKKEINKE